MSSYFSSLKKSKTIEPLEGIKVKSFHLSRTMLTRMEFAPHSAIPPHSHPHEQITMVIEGKMEMTVGGETRVMTAGDAAVVPSHISHSVRNLEEPTLVADAWSPPREDYK